jgi:hypothetical protein
MRGNPGIQQDSLARAFARRGCSENAFHGFGFKNACWRRPVSGRVINNRWAGRTPRQRTLATILPTNFVAGARRAPKTVILAGRAMPARVDSRASSRPSPTNPNEYCVGHIFPPPPSTFFSMGEVGECAEFGHPARFSRTRIRRRGCVLISDVTDLDSRTPATIGGPRKRSFLRDGLCLPGSISRASSRPSPTNRNDCWVGHAILLLHRCSFDGECGECAGNSGHPARFSRTRIRPEGGALKTHFTDLRRCTNQRTHAPVFNDHLIAMTIVHIFYDLFHWKPRPILLRYHHVKTVVDHLALFQGLQSAAA